MIGGTSHLTLPSEGMHLISQMLPIYQNSLTCDYTMAESSPEYVHAIDWIKVKEEKEKKLLLMEEEMQKDVKRMKVDISQVKFANHVCTQAAHVLYQPIGVSMSKPHTDKFAHAYVCKLHMQSTNQACTSSVDEISG